MKRPLAKRVDELEGVLGGHQEAMEALQGVLGGHQEAMEALQNTIEIVAKAVQDLHKRMGAVEAEKAEPLIVVPAFTGKVS